MLRARRGIQSVSMVILGGTAAAWIMLAQQPRQVDDALLKTGSTNGEEWVSYGTNWSEQRYSPLKQIDASNVSRLGLAWSYDIPIAPGNPQTHMEGTPLVFNGVLYAIAPWSIAYAVDLRTGKELWRSDPEVDQEVWQSRICCGVVNRGIALYEGKVIAPVVDGRLRALDAATGKQLWETRVAPDNMPYSITMAARVIQGGKVIVGVAGGEFAIRGFFAAYDVNTGKLAWRFYTVPGDPSKPFENPALEKAAKTWSGEWWKIGGGGAVWNAVAYDPDHDIVYVGTGQPGPWSDMHRGPGDNLYTTSILAVRGATGQLVWYYQEVPGDDWDFDAIADLMLADLRIDGKNRKVIMQAPKNGFFYVLDRVTGELISADPITKVSWTSGIDPKTGRPNVNAGARYRTTPVVVMPTPSVHIWPPWSYNPGTGLVYFTANAGKSFTYQANPDFVPGSTVIPPGERARLQVGTGRSNGRGAGRGDATPDVAAAAAALGRAPAAGSTPAPAEPPAPPLPVIGPGGPEGNVLYAWDPVARKERWRLAGAAGSQVQGGTLSTAGNLVFSSVNDKLMAFRADTGEKVLELETGLSQMGPPITFMIDGKQYVSVSGGATGVISSYNRPTDAAPTGPPRPGHLLVLALDAKAAMPITAPPPAK